MQTNPRFVKATGVTSDIVEGEAIIVNLQTGNYYSIQGIGAQLWQLALGGHEVPEMLRQILIQHDVIPAELEEYSETLLGLFVQEGLLRTAEPASYSAKPNRISHPWPRLEKYSDLQALLTLDPIHETESLGWPHSLNSESRTKPFGTA